MRADELIGRYTMDAHVENGLFIERHYQHIGAERAASGCMYYYLDKTERSVFHSIDCDEYWCYCEGAELEVWIIDYEGKLSVKHLGTGANAEPVILLQKGMIFAAKHSDSADDGTFLACITVPRFMYDGSVLYTRDAVVAKCEEAERFWQ